MLAVRLPVGRPILRAVRVHSANQVPLLVATVEIPPMAVWEVLAVSVQAALVLLRVVVELDRGPLARLELVHEAKSDSFTRRRMSWKQHSVFCFSL